MPDLYRFWIPDYWHSLDTTMQPTIVIEIVATFVYVLSLAVFFGSIVFLICASSKQIDKATDTWLISAMFFSFILSAMPPVALIFSYPFLYVVCPLIALYWLRQLVQRVINRGVK